MSDRAEKKPYVNISQIERSVCTHCPLMKDDGSTLLGYRLQNARSKPTDNTNGQLVTFVKVKSKHCKNFFDIECNYGLYGFES